MSEAVRAVTRKERPEFRNIHVTDILFNYRLPMPGKVSIMHRISGVLLFVLLPFILWLLDLSLKSEIQFDYFKGILGQPLVKLLVLAITVGYIAHFCAGIRHLFLDSHMAADKPAARKTAASVLIVTAVLSLLVALKLFGVF
ncbi:succinate dehydrogenase, cytochrome b556 subunit [Massilia arenosa]|uniref:Succinate dehydrogenase cytochrome b556 subunit n=1 Tax=Zemynaea arenosa TaxID=2561931 RepID=A0A4Y9SB65_9BURK|nr:succinate dehydrogenase, cytochrome b556 subunit [Massilia arenosa]TFW19338.1 succinate dehydrogenase, cytochrome b556 subunit [Massilia arenosa]